MGILVPALWVVAGIGLAAGLHHALLARAGERRAVDLWFAATCFLIVAYVVSGIAEYTAASLEAYVPAAKWHFALSYFAAIPYLAFVAAYTGLRPRWLMYVAATGLLVVVVVHLARPYGLAFDLVTGVENVEVPWGGGETVARAVGERNPLRGFFDMPATILLAVCVLTACWQQYRSGERRRATALVFTQLLVLAAGIHAGLVDSGVVVPPYLIEVAFIGLVVVMSLDLGRDVKDSDERYRNFVKANMVGIWRLEFREPMPTALSVEDQVEWLMQKAYFAECNDVFAREHGFESPEEIVGIRTAQIFGDEAEDIRRLIAHWVNSGYRIREEEAHEVTPDGHEKWFIHTTHAILDGGRVIRIWGTQRDITERKQIESRLERTTSLLQAAIEQSPAGIIIANAPDVTIERANSAALGIRGGVEKTLTRIPVDLHPERWQCFRPDGSPFEPAELPLSRAVLEGVSSHNVDVIIRRPDGEERWVLANAAPVRDKAGEIVAGIVVFPDVSELRKAERARREAYDHLEEKVRERTLELEESNRELASFSYSVSHDLKAPVRHIKSYAQILLDDHGDELAAEPKRDVEIILRAAQKLGGLIEDLLTLSRLGRQSLRRSRVDCRQLVRDTWSELGRTEDTRRVRFEVGDLPEIVADAGLLEHVFGNLLGNAVKYSSEREAPFVEVTSFERDDRTWFAVEDNGIGFEPDYSEKIFGVFERLHTEAEYVGSGVGLAIVKRIVDRHGGVIFAEGKPGKGARFELTFQGGAGGASRNAAD